MKEGILKSLRNSRGIAQKEFAHILGVSQQTIASWEIGRTEPSNGLLKDIANYFNVTTDYLLGKEAGKDSDYNEEEIKIMREYRELNELNRRQISNMISAFLVQQAAV